MSRDYGRVYGTFWSSKTTASMSDDGKLLSLYLMTCPHSTITGVFRLPDGYVAEDLGWSSERVAKGFAELFRKGFANRCETTKWVWVRKHLEWNRPENPNQRKAAAKVALSVPDECAWKLDFMRASAEVLELGPVPAANPSETVPEPFLNQKQEQEQEREAPTARSTPTRGTRLPKDWAVDDQGEADAIAAGLVNGRISVEACKFRDYWTAQPGQKGVKTDWPATWRNWCRRAAEDRRPGQQQLGGHAWDGAR